MFRIRLLPLIMTATLAACAQAPHKSEPVKSAAAPARVNPFLAPSTLPFQAPMFDKITDADYQPAIEEGIRQQLAEVDAIANDPAAPRSRTPTWHWRKPARCSRACTQRSTAWPAPIPTTPCKRCRKTWHRSLQRTQDAIHLNDKLFARIEKVYNERAKLKHDPESLRLIDVVHAQFVHAGAKLSAADKTKLKALNAEEATLEAAFNNKLLAAAKAGALVVDDKAKLAGLSDADIAAAAQAAKDRRLDGKWVFPLQNTTQQPELQDLTDRATRQALFEASWNRAEHGDANDTRATIERLAQLRAQKAKLLGLPNYAAWTLQDQMAKTPANVLDFMHKIVPAAVARATHGSSRHPGHDRQGPESAQAAVFQARTLGLGVLRRAGAQGQVRSG